MEKRLRFLRKKLLDYLTMTESVISKPRYNHIEEEIDGKIVVKRKYHKDHVTVCKLTDWVDAETLHRGNAARLRLRTLAREIREIAHEIKDITVELDKEYREKKDRGEL